MPINLRTLHFNLPDNPFGQSKEKLSELISELKVLEKESGTNNDKFKNAWKKINEAIRLNKPLENSIENKIDIRALASALSSENRNKIKITNILLNKIFTTSLHKPNNRIIESIFQYFLHEYNQINNKKDIAYWLRQTRKLRALDQVTDEYLISPSGPRWVANRAISMNKGFDQIADELRLDQFQSGQFMESAKRIYYVEQLKVIPLNQPHELLIEVQKPEVYRSQFDDSELLGHQVLKILIEKAPSHGIHDSWLNVIMAIAGDPRIPKSHKRYRTWWSHIPQSLISKVRGWLSRLDLKLFLEALEDFSNSSYDPEMKRMYPSRKRFLEGLYDKKLIQNTRLYMSRQMTYFLKKNYKAEHLPDFSTVADGDKSIIYVDLGNAHLLEGSHSCYLWVYKSLAPSATVFDYVKKQESYSGLTSGLDRRMGAKGHGSSANITHNPSNFSWQRKAIEVLKDLSVPVTMKDVLTDKDYRVYVRRFGVN